MKARARVWVWAFGFLTAFAFSSRADFSAFNDFAWSTGQPSNAITKYSTTGAVSGVLVSYPSGVTNSARLTISGAASAYTYVESIPSGSDAHVAFNGKVSCSNGLYWSVGTLTLSFTGLNPAKRYDLAAYSSRGSASATYSNRYTLATLSDVTSFVNASSSGALISSTSMTNDSTRIVAGNLSGMVFKYTAIEPGVDGDMQIRFVPLANPGYGTNGYLNAFMLIEYGGGPVFFVR